MNKKIQSQDKVKALFANAKRPCGLCGAEDTMLICMECRRRDLEKKEAEFKKMIESFSKEHLSKCSDEEANDMGIKQSGVISDLDIQELLAKLNDNHSPEDSTHKVQKNPVGSSGTSKGCGKEFMWIKYLNDKRICGQIEDLKHSNHILLCEDCKKKLCLACNGVGRHSSWCNRKKTGTCICGHDEFIYSADGKTRQCKKCKKFQEVGE